MDDTIYRKTGVPNKNKHFYHDNKSAIKIEKMGENHAVINKGSSM